jgi:transcriptional regulator GlxA family with amidase domain
MTILDRVGETTLEEVYKALEGIGFVSASHFSRRYRQLFGASPSDDRRRQRAGPIRANATRVNA